MIDENTIETFGEYGGSVGFVAFDINPRTTPGRVRPFIWSYLLLRGAVTRSEVVGALTGHVATDDTRVWDDPLNRTPLDINVDDCLASMVLAGLLRVNGELYVLRPEALAKTISIACQLDAQLPDHLLMEVGR